VIIEEPCWTSVDKAQRTSVPCSSTVATGMRPYIITGMIIQLLKYHFSDPNNIMTGELEGLLWSDVAACQTVEENTSDSSGSSGSACAEDQPEPAPANSRTLWIGGNHDLNLGMGSQRPGIFVKREKVSTKRVTNQKGDATVSSVQQSEGIVRGKKYLKELTGRFSIICVGLSGAEAELLGEEVFYRMLYYAPKIEDDFPLGRFSVNGLTEVTKLDAGAGEPTNAYSAIVQLSWGLIETWRLVSEAPLLKRTSLNYQQFENPLLTT